jgi:hypothetical protein
MLVSCTPSFRLVFVSEACEYLDTSLKTGVCEPMVHVFSGKKVLCDVQQGNKKLDIIAIQYREASMWVLDKNPGWWVKIET